MTLLWLKNKQPLSIRAVYLGLPINYNSIIIPSNGCSEYHYNSSLSWFRIIYMTWKYHKFLMELSFIGTKYFNRPATYFQVDIIISANKSLSSSCHDLFDIYYDCHNSTYLHCLALITLHKSWFTKQVSKSFIANL